MIRFCLLACLLSGLFACNGTPHSANNPAIVPEINIVSKDSANKMLNSYLNSIDYSTNDSSLRSISIDANVIRYYLDSIPESDSISKIKIMFAHTLEYINNGGGNINAGYGSGKFTLILAAYDQQGDYIYMPGNIVIDNGAGCPADCPPGEASNSLLQ